MERFGRENARASEHHGWNYYGRDFFKLLYRGHWGLCLGFGLDSGRRFE